MRLVAPLTDAERVRFVASARSMVGTKFRHRGRSARGVDCIGLVALAIQSVGRVIEDRDDYSRNPVNDGLREALTAHLGEPVADMQAGDVALFCWGDGAKDENHVGILFDHPCGGLAVVHALAQEKRVIEHGLDADAIARIATVFRP